MAKTINCDADTSLSLKTSGNIVQQLLSIGLYFITNQYNKYNKMGKNDYRRPFCKLMSHKRKYLLKGYYFRYHKKVLSDIFILKAYGTENPGETDCPTSARSGSLYGIKKMISSFMPLRYIAWDNVRREGNPTRSTAVNEMICTRCKVC